MKNSEYTYTRQGKPAMTCEENFAFGVERYADRLRQAETNRWIAAVTQPKTHSTNTFPVILRRLVAFGQAVLNL